jgi:hypothetical protein
VLPAAPRQVDVSAAAAAEPTSVPDASADMEFGDIPGPAVTFREDQAGAYTRPHFSLT